MIQKTIMDSRHKYLTVAINFLNKIKMWHGNRTSFFRESYLSVILFSAPASFTEFFVQFNEDDISFTKLMESLGAATALCSLIYTLVCFMIKKQEIKRLTDHLRTFEEFLPVAKIKEAEQSAALYTKIFVYYGIIGNISYISLPLFSLKQCKNNKTKHMIKYGIPCGTIGRYALPFRHDYFPLAQIVFLIQAVVSILGTTAIMSVTMLICGLVTHVSANLKHLEGMILDISESSYANRVNYVNSCVRYHTAIIDFVEQINKAFGYMMLVHITWTSVIISILGIEIIMNPNYTECFRFAMHLGGWLGMLLLICVYGQILMDASSAITRAVHKAKWYEEQPCVRKYFVLILLRSQRPLTLKAVGVNIMSLPTFLGVLSSAYSYFTLLLNIKP